MQAPKALATDNRWLVSRSTSVRCILWVDVYGILLHGSIVPVFAAPELEIDNIMHAGDVSGFHRKMVSQCRRERGGSGLYLWLDKFYKQGFEVFVGCY